MSRLVRAWLTTGVVDGLFACVLSLIYYSNVQIIWQGVASTVLGPSAMQGGVRTTIIGLLMHFGVALAWSSVFLAIYMASGGIRRLVRTSGGVLAAAAVYGPLIWVVMSLVVIPALTGRPASITPRWWIQVIGHIPFVALPMIWQIARGGDRD